MTKKQRLPFYNFNKLWSYQAYYNFVLGPRGTGKTYGAKVKAVKNAISKGEQFIYMRRYKEELRLGRDSFFSDIRREFPRYDFQVQGNLAQMSPASQRDVKNREWKTIGYFVALSTAGNQKSVSYPDVTLLIYDDFIIQKGAVRYLPNEARMFNEFYSTVDRYRGQVKALFLANAVSIMNPYFLEYDIDVVPGKEFVRKYDGFICVHFDKSEAFATEVFKTPFGKFIQNTEYANYAVGNEFADNDLELIKKKTEDATYRFTIETDNGTFSVWVNHSARLWYVQQKRPASEVMYTIVPERMTETKTLLVNSDAPLQLIKTAFRQGRLLFDSPLSRNAFREVFK